MKQILQAPIDISKDAWYFTSCRSFHRSVLWSRPSGLPVVSSCLKRRVNTSEVAKRSDERSRIYRYVFFTVADDETKIWIFSKAFKSAFKLARCLLHLIYRLKHVQTWVDCVNLVLFVIRLFSTDWRSWRLRFVSAARSWTAVSRSITSVGSTRNKPLWPNTGNVNFTAIWASTH